MPVSEASLYNRDGSVTTQDADGLSQEVLARQNILFADCAPSGNFPGGTFAYTIVARVWVPIEGRGTEDPDGSSAVAASMVPEVFVSQPAAADAAVVVEVREMHACISPLLLETQDPHILPAKMLYM